MNSGAVREYLLGLQERIVAQFAALGGGAFIRDEKARWAKVVKEAGIKAE